MTPENVQNALRRHEIAKAKRMPWLSIWRETSRFVNPIKDHIGMGLLGSKTPNIARHQLFDNTAQESLLVYAAGCMDWLTPASRPWFRLDAPAHLSDNDNVKKWLAKCTEEMQAEIGRSNFYSQIHEAYIDDGAFGTEALNTDEDDGLRFELFEIGEYSALMDHRGKVDTVFRELSLTPRQAAQKFGIENLSQDMRDVARDSQNRQGDEEVTFVHCCYPREDREQGKIDAVNMPFVSIYIEEKTKHVVQESGSWEMPTAVGRHLTWGKSPYGFAPAWTALAEARQVNNLQMNLDVLAEVAAFPRSIAPASLEGEIDLRKGGITYVEDIAQSPRVWATEGRYDIGKDRVQERQNAIKRAFHVNLFNMFAQFPPGKEMTLGEVQARIDADLTLFSPTFARKTGELIDPTISRSFNIMLRGGAFPSPPREMIEFMGDGVMSIADPKIKHSSRIALAMDRIHNQGFANTLQTFAQLFEYKPELLDNFNTDGAIRDSAMNFGTASDWLRDVDERDEMREARAQQQAEMAAQEQALAAQQAI